MESFQTMEGWYADLDARILDLVSDYAGRELFCLEGDSLVLECLDDPVLDFEDGFQVLHAIYMVERLLSRLLATNCNFHVVFFDENSEISHYAASKDIYRSKYALAREVIYQHLAAHLHKKNTDIQVCRFPAVNSPEFQSHVQTYSVYFAICHNGALRRQNAQTAESMLHVLQRVMASGLDVAIINEIEWRDSKIMTKVIQAKSRNNSVTEAPDEGKIIKNTENPSCLQSCIQNLQSLAKSGSSSVKPNITARGALTLAVLSALVEETPNKQSRRMAARVLFQLACIESLKLEERRFIVPELPDPDLEVHNAFFDRFCLATTAVLRSLEWNQYLNAAWEGGIHDLIDGRILRSCAATKAWVDNEAGWSRQIDGSRDALFQCYRDISAFATHEASRIATNEKGPAPCNPSSKRMRLLPFEHKVFDDHLASIRVEIEDSDIEDFEKAIQDDTHWHVRKKLNAKESMSKTTNTKWNNPNRFNQKRSRDMENYAASLTNVKGGALEPQLIISPELRKPEPEAKETMSSKGRKIANENKANTIMKEESSWTESWKRKAKEMEKMEARLQIAETQSYIDKLDGRKKIFLEPETRFYLLSVLIGQWQSREYTNKGKNRIILATEIWDQIRILRQKVDQMPQECYCEFQAVCKKLCAPDIPQPLSELPSRPLSFLPGTSSIKSEQLGAPFNFQEFQLMHCGPIMDRQTGAKPDSRVPFEPDEWQRNVLDELDKENSLFVVAPTSAGKTFISFHAISKVLQDDDTGVLVYVAPTKALVNQIAAEVHARFKKSYPPNSGQCVWAIQTRDIRFNDPMKCQVLVTVPQFLQIMLLAPTNARTWAPRVKCIIFDEIHSIGNSGEGLVWEQLLLLAPCRIIALSATVGNPNEFAGWLSRMQKFLGIDLKLIQHGQRYSDLRKHFYVAPKDFNFKELPKTKRAEELEPSLVKGLQAVHPVTSLLNRKRQIPEDLSLEPRDCLVLWRCLLRHATAEFPVPEELHPKHTLPPFIRRINVFKWEYCLKDFLSTWMLDRKSPFEKVRNELESIFSPCPETTLQESVYTENGTAWSSIFPLLVGLHEQNALPALLFNYDRGACEKIAGAVLTQLYEAEEEYKKGVAWQKKILDYEKYKSMLEKKARTEEKNAHAAQKRKPSEDDSANPAEKEGHPFDSFNPDKPLEQFSFADFRVYEWDSLKEEISWLNRFGISAVLLESLQRGIGVHHAGLNRRYRQCVERLFRKGYLRVVVATGTLALGINMPCSTVVFCGGSVFLTALNYRQASGRAGRRGFDLLGNVIFHGMPRHKAYQLMSSRLPDLNGHFPITTSLVLRLCILLNNSDNSPYAVRAVNSLLSQSRLSFSGAESQDKVLHHLRFSIEYLRRQSLLGRYGQPINLARSVAHLYYTENSAFAFHALLRGGYFQTLCQLTRNNKEKKLDTLMIILANLFCRKSLGKRHEMLLKRKDKIKSPSAVILPEIPHDAAEIIRKHNEEILATYTAYVTTYIDQHLRGAEIELPLSGIITGGPGNPALSQAMGASAANKYRSPFVGLSGHDDKFSSIKELCRTVRSEVFLEESVIPHLSVYPDNGMPPLNAYLYDFFHHGSLKPLINANRIASSESWFLLNDFSLILATIIVALESYLDPSLEDQAGVMDPMGAGDCMDEEEDEEVEENDDEFYQEKENKARPNTKTPATGMSNGSALNAKLKTNATHSDSNDIPENWDDGSSDISSPDNWSEEPWSDRDSDAPVETHTGVSREVLEAFRQLKDIFDQKFHAIFA